MNISAEQFKKEYTEFKRSVLLEDDIKFLNSLTEAVNRFPKVTDKNELIQLESEIANYGFQLSGIYGRLLGQYNVEKDILEKKKSELVSSGAVKSMAGAERQFAQDSYGEVKELSMFEGVIEEYKAKLYSLNEVHLAITHRIGKLNQ